MRKSRCKHCIEGAVLSPDFRRRTSNYLCELDEWDDDRSCTPTGCHYYTKDKEAKGEIHERD